MDDCPDKAKIQCYGCSEFGHLRKECTKKGDDTRGTAMQEELLETRQTLQDTQQQLQRALYEIGQLREDLRVAKTQHEGWRAFTASINTDPYTILKMQGLHKSNLPVGILSITLRY